MINRQYFLRKVFRQKCHFHQLHSRFLIHLLRPSSMLDGVYPIGVVAALLEQDAFHSDLWQARHPSSELIVP